MKTPLAVTALAALGLGLPAAMPLPPAAPPPGVRAALTGAPDGPTPAAALLLTGRVTDPSGRALGQAQVSVPSQNAGALSNAQGRFLVLLDEGLVGSRITVRVELIGYARAEKTVTLAERGNVVDFQLSPASVALEETAVTGSRDDVAASKQANRAPGEAESLPAIARPAMPVSGAAGDAVMHRRREGGPWPRLPGRYNPNFNTESYDRIVENPFLAVGPNPLSTFSIDVDRASYANVRRFLREGRMPPPDAVRIEELVNYFSYRDPAPDEGGPPFRVTTDVAPAPWQPLHKLVRIGLRARDVDLENIPPSNLVFLVDVSGSMQSPDKLPLLKTALNMLVHQLRPRDRVAIVVYAGAAGLVLESTPGSHKEKIQATIERLEAGGSTAGGAGIRLAYDVARKNHVRGGNNRVILATDGDFNVGASSDGEMVRLIEEKREQGTFLTVLGFGTGNLKDSKMEKLADHGNGNFAYIDSALEAKKVLVSEMGGTLFTVAKDVKIQVEFNPARVAGYRLIGYENRLLAAEDFDDDTKDAGELGAGHTVTALYEVVPVGVEGTVELRDVDGLRYRDDAGVRPGAGATGELLFVKLRYKEPDGRTSRLIEHAVHDGRGEDVRTSDDFRFAAAVAGWGMLLRGSEHCGGLTYEAVERLARSALGEDREGYRAEFVHLVEVSRDLADRPHAHGEGRRR